QRTEAGDHASGAIAERNRGGAHLGWEQLRQVDGVTGEHAEYEIAEYRQQVRVKIPGLDAEKQVKAGDNRADVVEYDRRPPADRIGDEAERGIAKDAAKTPQRHAMANVRGARCTGNANLLEQVGLDRRQPDLAGPDRQQRAKAKQNADEGAVAQLF